MEILQQLNPDNTVSFNRPLAHSMGLCAALVYSALISKQEYYSAHGMLDSEGFFYSTVDDLQESTTLSKRRQSAAIKQLAEAGLIECKRCGMPARRYFRVTDEPQPLNELLERGEEAMHRLNPIAQKNRNAAASGSENAPQEVTKCNNKSEQNVPYNINPNINKSEESNPYPSIHGDGMEKMDITQDKRSEYLGIIRENIGYDALPDKQRADELVGIMLDVICSVKSTVRVNGEDVPQQAVKSRFLKLEYEHINYVLLSLKKNTSAVRNIRAYLITALYNAPTTIDSYHSALVNHDIHPDSPPAPGRAP